MGIAVAALRYLTDPRPDIVPALKLLLSPECKLPLWRFVRYFGALLATKIPGAASLFSGQDHSVSFISYMTAYDRTTASYHPYQQMHARIIELAGNLTGKVVADLGSGTGNLSIRLKAAGASVISFDNSPEANGLHKFKDKQADIRKVNLDRSADVLGFTELGDQSVDVVTVANLWTYIENRATLYAEIRRILRPEGRVILQVEREGYDPAQILKAHLTESYRRYSQGFPPVTAALKVYTDFISRYQELLIVAEETKKLVQGMVAGQFAVFSAQSITAEATANGYAVVTGPELAYAEQALILTLRPQPADS